MFIINFFLQGKIKFKESSNLPRIKTFSVNTRTFRLGYLFSNRFNYSTVIFEYLIIQNIPNLKS